MFNSYLENETYESKFTDISNLLEEFRADLAGLFFGFNKDLHQIFEINESYYKDVIYVMWFIYIRIGIDGLQFFNEENKQWGQVQSKNAWVFTSFILENQIKGQEILIVTLEEDKKAFSVTLNEEMILCYGQELTEKILTYFHIWKSTGACASAREFYNKYSFIDDFFLKIRKIVCDNAQLRPLDLYHNINFDTQDKSVSLAEYPETMEGIIQSFVDRFHTDLNKDIYEQWTKYDTNFIK